MRALLIGIAVGLTLGLYTFTLLNMGYNSGYTLGYKKGYDSYPAMTVETFKEMLVSQTDYTNKVCHLWWFKMDHTERKLK